MKRIKIILAATAIAAAVSCTSLKEEFQPVFTLEYEQPAPYAPADMKANTTIAELCGMYTTGKPWNIDKDIIIKGQVTTTDRPGNFYKSFYIQDGTGGIELKLGKNGLYNDYLPGQWVYVKCHGLTLGMYGYKDGNYGGQGMIQIGYEDPTESYETAYLESTMLIDTHVFKGPMGDPVEPVVLSEEQLPKKTSTQKTNKYIGTLVTLKGLRYANQAFCLVYINSNVDKKKSSNRFFLSDKPWGITTWAMSESKFKEYLDSGVWDECPIGNANDYNYGTVADKKADIRKGAAAYSVSQYFTMGDTEIQLRTSGYSKFGDQEIPVEVLNGDATVDMTGILTMYQGSIQFTVNSLDDIVVNH